MSSMSFLLPAGTGDMWLFDADACQPDELREGRQVHQTIPADGEGTD